MVRYSLIFLFFFSVLLTEHQAVAQEELSEAYLSQQDAIFDYQNGNRTTSVKRLGNASTVNSDSTTHRQIRSSYLDIFIDLITAIFQGNRE